MQAALAWVSLVGAAPSLAFCLVAWVPSRTAIHNATSRAPRTQTEQTFDQKQKLAELQRQIAGKERMPAEQVYKNIQDYRGVPAGSLLRGMEFYTRALGVDCTHCHVVDEWEKDEKPAKQIAREMSALVDAIQESLARMKNLKSERPVISCATCHRGQLKPAISVP